MKKLLFIFFLIFSIVLVYALEPGLPLECMNDYIKQIENIINKKDEAVGKDKNYIIMEYSEDSSPDTFGIHTENIANIYLIENTEIKKLTSDRKEIYQIIKKIGKSHMNNLSNMNLVYFKCVGNKIFIILENYLVYYKLNTEIKRSGDGEIKIINIPDWFFDFEYYQLLSTVYYSWYK